MKRLLIHILCLVTPCLSLAQGWITKDVNLVVKDNAHIVIHEVTGHYTNKGTGLILTRNHGTIHVDGNWVNNGSTMAIGNNAGTVSLDGGVQQISGITPTYFNTLELHGTGDKTLDIRTLVGGGYNGSPSGTLDLNDQNLILNSNLLEINNKKPVAISRVTGLIIGETTPAAGYGKVQWNVRNTGGTTFEIPFGTTDFIHIPITMKLGSAGTQVSDSGFIAVATYPTNSAASPNNRPLPPGVPHLDNQYKIENDIKMVDRFYVIDGDGYSTNPNLSVGFSYVDREWDGSLGGSNDISESELETTRYNPSTGSWDYNLKGSTSTAANQTFSPTVNNYTGAWTLHNKPYCPISNFIFNPECFEVPVLLKDSSYILSGTIDTSVWVYDGIETYSQNQVLHNFSSDGYFNVMRKVRGDRGCWDSIEKQVQVFPLPINSFDYADTCFSDYTTFVSTSTSTLGMPLSHHWVIEGTDYYTPSPGHTFSSEGLKPISLITRNTFGCEDTLVKNIEIEPLPAVFFSFENICERQEAFFFDSTKTNGKGSIDEWAWTVRERKVSYLQNHSQTFNLAGTYPIQLTVRNSFGCVDSISRNLVVWPKPVAKFDVFPKEIYITEPYVNFVQSGSNADTWEWRFGDLSDDEFGPETFHEYTDTGLFNVRMIASNEFGCMDTFFKTLLIKPDLKIFIPNAFSPGPENDVNLTFGPAGMLYSLKKLEMDIYTRWGELIYHTEDLNKPWDGMYMGHYVQEGTYLYLIKIKDIYNDVFHFSGTVTVIR